jgi:hypothetical protein
VSSLLLVSAILMAVREQPFHLSRCPNFRNRLTGRLLEMKGQCIFRNFFSTHQRGRVTCHRTSLVAFPVFP